MIQGIIRPSLNKISIGLILMIVLAFLVGAYRVDKQARDINGLIAAQSPLVFEFDTSAGKVVVVCVKNDNAEKYVCTTTQPIQ